MSKGVSKRTVAALCAVCAVAAFGASTVLMQLQFEARLPDYAANNAIYTKLGEIRQRVDDYYVGEYDVQDAVDMACVGFITGVGDRWSGYMSKEEYETYMTSLEGQATGIGVYTTYDQEQNRLRIIEVYHGSGAEEAGLAHGDEIVGAGGKALETDGYQAVIDAIAGDEGTMAEVTVRRAATGQTETLSIERREVEATMVTGRMLDDETGYIYIYNFHQHADEQFEQTVDSLLEQGAQRLIFDVRNDPGGSVEVLSNMLDPLLPEGTIMTLRAKDGEEVVYSSDAAALDIPMAVLVNADSISAAEFFAAALQEYGKAIVVGEQTIGKGYSQRTYPLSDGSALRLSDNEYFTPQGKSLIGTGVTPDVPADLPDDKAKDFYFLSPEQDDQLIAARQALDELGA